MSPAVKYGKFEAREMFYGESEVIFAEVGYSYLAKPEDGLSFTITVSEEGKYTGLKTFLPVACGAPPKVGKSLTTFAKPKASFGDLIPYKCVDGYSTDATEAPAAESFTITCE